MKSLTKIFNNAMNWRRFAVPAMLLWLGGASIRAEDYPRTTADGYAIPQPGRQFSFPRDYGSHPEFAIEWWYITGHLFATNEPSAPERFGFQATFFRRSIIP